MEIFSEPLTTAQDLYLFLQSIGEEARERLFLELNVGDHAQANPSHNITAEAIEIVDSGALVQVFALRSEEQD